MGKVNRAYKPLKHPTLDSLNQSYTLGHLSKNEVFVLLKDLRERIYREWGQSKPLGLNSNFKILDQHWKSYPRKRRLKDPQSAYSSTKHAVSMIKSDLYTASKDDLQNEVDSIWCGSKHNKYVSRINMLLRFINRDFVLDIDPIKRRHVTSLTQAEVLRLVKRIDDQDMRLIVLTAFATGARLGEVYGLKTLDLKEKHVTITKQLDRTSKVRETKTGGSRDAYIINGFKDVVAQWCGVPNKEKLQNKRHYLSKNFKQLTSKYLNHEVKFHDLRHSYAIHLLERGVSIDLVAQSLGNSTSVCQKYYVGYSLSSSSMEFIDSILNMR